MKIKTNTKAGFIPNPMNHNQTLVRNLKTSAKSGGLKVRSNLKAGFLIPPGAR